MTTLGFWFAFVTCFVDFQKKKDYFIFVELFLLLLPRSFGWSFGRYEQVQKVDRMRVRIKSNGRSLRK